MRGVARVLVTGGTGFLGAEVVAQAVAAGHEVVATWHHREPVAGPGGRWERLELAARADIVSLLHRVRPDLVVHTGYVERGPELTAVTAEAPGTIAEWCAGAGCRLVHVSSDVVHRGECGVTYADGAAPDPVHDYGRAKAAAERAVLAADPAALVARTSLILSGPDRAPGRHEQLVADAAAGAEVVFFDDEIRCPVAVDDLAGALLALAAGGLAGTLNVAGADAVSRAELARLVARQLGVDPATLRTGPTPPHLTDRPRCVVLDSAVAARHHPLRGARQLDG